MAAKQNLTDKNIERENKITKVLSKVCEICDYAVKNCCTEQSQFEELEMLLRDYIH